MLTGGAKTVLEPIISIYYSASLLQHKLSEWWMAKIRFPYHKAISSLIPACIYWELCIHLNKARFDNNQ